MAKYTPTTPQVRLAAQDSYATRVSGPAFDRWLAAELAAAERRGAVKALREFADANRMPWTMFLRADDSPVTVGDLMRETAARIEQEAE